MNFVEECLEMKALLERACGAKFDPPTEALPDELPTEARMFYSQVAAQGAGILFPEPFVANEEQMFFVADYGCGTYAALTKGDQLWYFDGDQKEQDLGKFGDWASGMLRGAISQWVERKAQAHEEARTVPSIEIAAIFRAYPPRQAERRGIVHLVLSEFDDAARAFAHFEREGAPFPAKTARVHLHRGHLAWRQSDLPAAERELRQGLAVPVREFGEEHHRVRRVLIELLIDQGRTSEAKTITLEHLERTSRELFAYEALSHLLAQEGDHDELHRLLMRGVHKSVGVREYDHEREASFERRMREFYDRLVEMLPEPARSEMIQRREQDPKR